VSTPIKRKLAAILSADVAGYSRLMGVDEERTLRLLAAHRAIVDSIIDLHDGRVVNTAGDSVLAEFASPVEAVRAASEIQDALRTRNESLPEDSRMLFRIGVHLGDVMIKGDDLLGDGVNVAARLQAVAEPGGICISGAIYDQVEGKLSLHFQDIGEQALKNIARPVRALVVRGSVPALSAPAAPARHRPRRRLRAALIGGAIAAVLAASAYLGGLVPGAGSADARRERIAWEAVHDTGDLTALEGYLAAHPQGAHAGDARARIAGLLARARLAAEAERARAEADLARVKAGQAEAVRLKAEADATRVKAEADAARAKIEAEADRKKVEDERAAAGRTTAAVVARESRFDGVWVGEIVCPEWRNRPAIRQLHRIVVRNGEMTLEIGPPRGPRTVRSSGKVRDDDTIELRGAAVSPAGRPFEHVMQGRFGPDGFTARAEPPARPCSCQLARE
jgi:class 3 adenylate cyclase